MNCARACSQQDDLRLSDLPSGQSAGEGTLIRDRHIPVHVRADSPCTVPRTSRVRLVRESNDGSRISLPLGIGSDFRFESVWLLSLQRVHLAAWSDDEDQILQATGSLDGNRARLAKDPKMEIESACS
ncbi:hypothetical protein PoB_003178400 [Plakobranchus ocellatus]|uniref:Uncharacterized protein n=1 Tax=Plakobranchus ocellatus TaxID=259542 RepID=A0AAV4AG95_9GAST|nr:hypothetical protein PoB_003178400 [Plakobranchus ocellatus]